MGDGYDYAYDNPANFSDPSGLSPISERGCVTASDNPYRAGSRNHAWWLQLYADQMCGAL